MISPAQTIQFGKTVLRNASLLALLGAVDCADAAQAQSDFCKDFNFVYKQRFEGFRKIQGLRQDDDTFLPLVTLPNAYYCKIHASEVSNSATYYCAWRYTDQTRAVEDARILVSSIKACIGPDARTSPGYVSEPPPIFQNTVWDSKSSSGTQVKVENMESGTAAERTVLFMRIELRD